MNNGTSWSSKIGKQDGSEEINLELSKAKKMQGIALSVYEFPADYPRGLRVEASENCSTYHPF